MRALAGHTLLDYTARAARGSGVIDRLILSTDSQEIADADPQFMPFGARVAHLAKELQLDELEQFIQQYMENKHL